MYVGEPIRGTVADRLHRYGQDWLRRGLHPSMIWEKGAESPLAPPPAPETLPPRAATPASRVKGRGPRRSKHNHN